MLRPRNLPTDEQFAETHPELVAEKTALDKEVTTSFDSIVDWNARCEAFRQRWKTAGLPRGASLAFRGAHGRASRERLTPIRAEVLKGAKKFQTIKEANEYSNHCIVVNDDLYGVTAKEHFRYVTNTNGYALDVPYAEKDAAKKLGAKWQPEMKIWYIPAEITDHAPFARWMA